jgi:hypothetical protein
MDDEVDTPGNLALLRGWLGGDRLGRDLLNHGAISPIEIEDIRNFPIRPCWTKKSFKRALIHTHSERNERFAVKWLK